jgi:hypothetical protein
MVSPTTPSFKSRETVGFPYDPFLLREPEVILKGSGCRAKPDWLNSKLFLK